MHGIQIETLRLEFKYFTVQRCKSLSKFTQDPQRIGYQLVSLWIMGLPEGLT